MSRYSYIASRTESQYPSRNFSPKNGLSVSASSPSRRARYSDLPGMVRALLQRFARGSILYVPQNGALSPDDRLLAEYLYFRWVMGWKHTVAVAEVAADAGLSVDTVARRLRHIRRRQSEQTLRGALGDRAQGSGGS